MTTRPGCFPPPLDQAGDVTWYREHGYAVPAPAWSYRAPGASACIRWPPPRAWMMPAGVSSPPSTLRTPRSERGAPSSCRRTGCSLARGNVACPGTPTSSSPSPWTRPSCRMRTRRRTTCGPSFSPTAGAWARKEGSTSCDWTGWSPSPRCGSTAPGSAPPRAPACPASWT
ncbi:MAG: hypothetical protein Q605_AUC01068G0002 [Actinomyces urogenitalis DORA_12]|uniref:Uncharacterized protein n=1 Tax=Actinomyces urogenitalis DORA_12 TaxID=1403939 RepID=W1VC79_9ACTO|nr:MAG: hypothetical protein Q605_AUC01068G0002 [Actinomyces urogenitalis DORA_12]